MIIFYKFKDGLVNTTFIFNCILKDMLEKNIITGEFDVIAGGLNAAYLSYGENIKDNISPLEDWSIFNSNPLENTIKKILRNKKYNKNNPITLIGSN